MELIRLLDEAEAETLRRRAELLLNEWNTVMAQVRRRRAQLANILEQSRAFSQLSSELQIWLNDAEQVIHS